MKSILKKFSFFLIFISVLLIPYTVNAENSDDLTKRLNDITGYNNLTPSKNNLYLLNPYVIDKYDINIKVNLDNTFDIEEDITVYFNESRHGIYRTIPLKNTVKREDGTETKNKARISNIKVNDEYTTTRENNNLSLKIGSKNKTIKGEKHYNIKYKYKLGKDPLKDKDELYFNIIGTSWDTVIGNVSFTITMPKEFDQTKLGFSAGSYGISGTRDVKYTVDGKVITGTYNKILDKNEGLTIRLELDEGYFVVKGFSDSPLVYTLIFIPLIFLAVAYYLWNKYGRDDLVTETVEFYPPKGKNSLDVGFLYKGRANNNDVVSLLIYLANKGYIKIQEIEDKKMFSKGKSFKLIKLKEYDGEDENEKTFFKGLFKSKNEVTADDLYDEFYITMDKILANKNRSKNKNELFEKGRISKAILIVLMVILTFIIITVPAVLEFGDEEDLVFALVFPAIGFSLVFISLFVNNDSINMPKSSKIFAIIVGLLFGGFPFIFLTLPILLEAKIYMIIYIIGFISIAGMIICAAYMSKRTPYGNEMLGKIRGFKHFLETAEKDKLEKMVEDDPKYFYNILPYTYVLGVSDKWIKKFEDIALKAPDWYDSSNTFDIIYFNSFVNSTVTKASSVMNSRPSSSSGGGGFSGGGFSGGGSGGGGGGSW